MITGRCLCGDVTWKTDGTQEWACYCHCDSCRRNCAAPVAAFFGVGNGHWSWTGKTPKTYVSAPGVNRYFCPNCGTPMAYEAEKFPGEVHFYAASMDEPGEFVAEFHVHHAEALPWLDIHDTLPRYPGSANDGVPE